MVWSYRHEISSQGALKEQPLGEYLQYASVFLTLHISTRDTEVQTLEKLLSTRVLHSLSKQLSVDKTPDLQPLKAVVTLAQ